MEAQSPGADRSSPNARVNQLAGLKPFGVSSPPGGNSPRVERDQIGRRRADVDQDPAASQAPSAQRASPAPASLPPRQSADLADFGDRVKFAVDAPDHRLAARQPLDCRIKDGPHADGLGRITVAKLGGHGHDGPIRKAEAPPRHRRSPAPARQAASRPQTGSSRPGRQLWATLMFAPPMSRAMQEVCIRNECDCS